MEYRWCCYPEPRQRLQFISLLCTVVEAAELLRIILVSQSNMVVRKKPKFGISLGLTFLCMGNALRSQKMSLKIVFVVPMEAVKHLNLIFCKPE